jgi:hypothetical protein
MCRQSKSFLYTGQSGVSQSTNLSPLFSIQHINYLSTTVKHLKYLLCADNLKVYKEINNEKGAMKLPEDMDMVYD